MHGAGWQHDGRSPSVNKLSSGNCFVAAAIVVRLPFCSREVGLPVLARLHRPGKGNGPGKVEVAAALVSQPALAFPCRIPRNAVLYDLAPPRTGKRGRSAPRETGPAPR